MDKVSILLTLCVGNPPTMHSVDIFFVEKGAYWTKRLWCLITSRFTYIFFGLLFVLHPFFRITFRCTHILRDYFSFSTRSFFQDYFTFYTHSSGSLAMGQWDDCPMKMLQNWRIWGVKRAHGSEKNDDITVIKLTKPSRAEGGGGGGGHC